VWASGIPDHFEWLPWVERGEDGGEWSFRNDPTGRGHLSGLEAKGYVMLRASDTIEAKLEMADRPPAFKCAEVWGGNRAVESPLRSPGSTASSCRGPVTVGRGAISTTRRSVGPG